MAFASAHAGKEAHDKVIAVVDAHGRENALHVFQRKRIHVGLALLELFDGGHRWFKLESVGGFVQDLA